MMALVLLRWRRDGAGFTTREIGAAEALAQLEFFAKDLGVFDPERAPDVRGAVRDDAGYAPLLEGLRIVEVRGKVDFPALVQLVADLLDR